MLGRGVLIDETYSRIAAGAFTDIDGRSITQWDTAR